MWDDLPTWLLGLLGISVSANLWARGSTRRIATLRSQADLWASLPNGPGRDRLEAFVARRADALMNRLEGSETHWSERWTVRFERLWWIGTAVVAVGYVLHVTNDESATVTVSSTLAILVGAIALVVAISGVVVTTTATVVAWLRRVSADRKARTTASAAAPDRIT